MRRGLLEEIIHNRRHTMTKVKHTKGHAEPTEDHIFIDVYLTT